MIGQTISHYKVIEKLGEGGMGEVFLAQDATLDRKVETRSVRLQLAPPPLRPSLHCPAAADESDA